MHPFLEKVLATISAHGMLAGCRRVLLGVSGGPDSLALLHALVELRSGRLPDLALYAGHLHHGLRGAEADEDARAIAATCARLGVPCRIERRDVRLLARERRLGEEAAGRLARYDFLLRMAGDVVAERIATGHQADDQAETVLMRLMRGAGPRGLGGIPYVRPAAGDGRLLIIRPLLDCTRREIVDFLGARNATSRLDRTNLSPRHLRNRVRHRILPALEEEWEGELRRDLLRFAGASRRLHRCGLRLAEAASVRWQPLLEPGYVEVPCHHLAAVPEAALAEIVRCWTACAGLAARCPDRRHYQRVAAVVGGRLSSTTLPGGVVALRDRDRLIIHRPEDDPCADFQAPLRVDGQTPIPPLGWVVEAVTLAGNVSRIRQRIERKEKTDEFLDMDRLRAPLVLRFPRPGDRMRLLGAPGRKKIHDILADRAVPRARRRRTLLLTARGEVVWLCGHGPAEDVRLTDATRRVLWLRRRRRA